MEGLTLRAPGAKQTFTPVTAGGGGVVVTHNEPVLLTISAGTVHFGADHHHHHAAPVGRARKAASDDDDEKKRSKGACIPLCWPYSALAFCCTLFLGVAAVALAVGLGAGLGLAGSGSNVAGGTPFVSTAPGISMLVTLPFVGGTAGDVLYAPAAGNVAFGVVRA